MFRDESMHMAFAFDVVETVGEQESDLFDEVTAVQVREMLAAAVECEYLQHVADWRLTRAAVRQQDPVRLPGVAGRIGALNFFERQVSSYQVGVTGTVGFDEDF